MKRAGTALLLVVALAVVIAAGMGWSEGYRLYAVRTGSMYPTYPVGSLVVDAPPSPNGGAPGDVVTFRTGGGLITHRIVEVAPTGLKTKGDANETADAWTIPLENVVGRVIASAPNLGYILVFFKQPAGVLAVVSGLGMMILLWNLFFPEDDEEDGPAFMAPVPPEGHSLIKTSAGDPSGKANSSSQFPPDNSR